MNLFKKDYELILSLLDEELKNHKIDSHEYEHIEGLYDEVNTAYEEMLEVTQEETEDYESQCNGCGIFISGGRICRECSAV